MRRDELLRRKMAEDTAAYTLKPGPKAELDGLREAREESGAIAPRPGACPVRERPRVHPPHISGVLSPCDRAGMKVTPNPIPTPHPHPNQT